MARTRIIEGNWNCSSCGAKGILARHKSCPTCGSPREAGGAESTFDFGAANAKGGLEREAVTEIAGLSLAAAGVDWFCSYCGASNRGDDAACRTCGATRVDAAAAVGPPAPPVRGGRWKKLILAIVVTFSGCMGWGYWLLQTRDYEGVVQSVSWERTLTRQAFTSVQRRGWRDQLQERATILPVKGLGEFVGTDNIRDCVEKQRGTRQVAVGTKQVCTTKSRSVACGSHESCSTRDLGNGYAEEVCSDVTDYCSESYEDCRDETQYRTDPVFAQECAYSTYEWQQLDQRSARGGSEPPVWPELAVEGELERLVPAERYEVVLEYQDDGLHSARFHPVDAADFAQWPLGRKLTLVVQNSGKLVGIREGDKTLPVEAAKP